MLGKGQDHDDDSPLKIKKQGTSKNRKYSTSDAIDEESDEESPGKGRAGSDGSDSDYTPMLKPADGEDDEESQQSSVKLVDLSNYFTKEEVIKQVEEQIKQESVLLKMDYGFNFEK